MIVEVDIEKLIKAGLDFNQYLFCQFVYQQSKPELEKYLDMFGKFFDRDSLEFIRSLGYLDLTEEKEGYKFGNMFVTEVFVSDFIEKPKITKVNGEEVDHWIDEWYELFPRGVKSGNYLVRSDKNGCLIKLRKFVKKNPEYSKEIIMKATAEYVRYCRMNNYKFMQLAHYFILKNDSSTLSAQCEAILHRMKTGEVDLMEVDNINDI